MALSPVAERYLEAACDIHQNPYEGEAAYTARELVQVTLPHSNPGNVPLWSRKNGNLTLTIQPGQERGHLLGYPYGSIPRLLVFWMTTEALRTDSRCLELGKSLTRFMEDIGLNPNNGGAGAKRSDARRLREHMKRLFGARISFEYQKNQSGLVNHHSLNMEVASESCFWWNEKQPDQAMLFGSWINLGENFFKAITAAPVPVDVRALRALQNSALALDLYTWSTYRTFRVSEKGKEQFVSWRGLMQQLGADYGDVQNFRRKAEASLKKIQMVYPDLRLESVTGGLSIKPSKTAVAPRALSPRPLAIAS
jgi:hypothetical protein